MPGAFQFGKTKIFVRKPVTLFGLEEFRERKLHDIVTVVQQTYRAYKARKFFLELREKSLSLFGGNKRRRGSVHLYFLGDYLNAGDELGVQKVMHKFGENKVLFAEIVTKINTKFKSEDRVLLLTEKALYNFTPKKFKLQRRMPLTSVEKVSMSTMADNHFVIGMTWPGDKRGDYLLESQRKAEIATALREAIDNLPGDRQLDFVFSDTLEWKVKGGKTRGAEFLEDESIAPPTATRTRGDRKRGVLVVACGSELCSSAPIQLSRKNPSFHRKGGGSDGATSQAKARRPSMKGLTSLPGRHGRTRSSAGGVTYGKNIGQKRSKTSSSSVAPPVPNRKKSKAPPPIPKRKQCMLALFDYAASDGDELSFREGDKLTVVSKTGQPDGWIKCALNGKEGLVPENYVKSA